MAGQSFQYRDLNPSVNEIRIIRWVAPVNDDDDEVRCDLLHRSLDEQPTYDALSYVWGEPEPAQKIHVNGKPVSVTPNLYGTLRQIRHAGCDVWVDALCINQKDDVEKGSQVPLMGRIYQQADYVISWLGEGGDGIDIALKFIEVLKDELLKRSEMVSRMLGSEEEPFNTLWQAVGELLGHPYWTRVWIVQEILLARNPVLCSGAESCAWDVFQLLFTHLDMRAFGVLSTAAREALLFLCGDLARNLSLLYNQRFGGRQMTLMDCLVLARQRRATNPRDYVYGTLGLVEGHFLAVDYSLPTATVFTKLVEYMAKHDGTLDILSACLPRKFSGAESVQVSPVRIPPAIIGYAKFLIRRISQAESKGWVRRQEGRQVRERGREKIIPRAIRSAELAKMKISPPGC